MSRVVITASSFCKNEILCAEVVAAMPDVEIVFHPLNSKSNPLEVAAALNGFDGAIVGREPVTSAVLMQARPPRVLVKYGVGMDNIDPVVFGRIAVLGTPGSNAFAVAEHTLGLILCLTHNIASCDRQLRAGHWWKNGGTTLAGKSVAVIGVGHIGSRVARLMRAFDCQVFGVDILDRSDVLIEIGARQLDLESAIGIADIVTFHVPLTELTARMVDRKFLASMKAGSWLLNTCRGGIMVESELLEALNSGHLAGAGLDVFEVEPTENTELIQHQSVVCTPHTAGNAREAVLAMGRASITVIASNIKLI